MRFLRISLKVSSLLWGLALAIAWGAGQAWASCGTENCPLDLSGHEGLNQLDLSATSRFNLQMGFEAIDQDQPWAGTHKIRFGQISRPDHDELETTSQNLRFVANYALTPRWSLRAGLPLLHRSHSHLARSGHHEEEEGMDHDPEKEGQAELEEWDYTSLGDLSVWGRYRLLPSARVVAGLGLSLPTGRTNMRNEHGELAEPSFQPGRGAVGVLFELSVERFQHEVPALMGKGTARLFASTLYQVNLRGKEAYQFGDEWLLHAGGQYPLMQRVDLLGQVVARWRDQDEPGDTGELVDATGGTFLYLSPGLQFELVPGLSLYGYYQMPVHRDVNAVQLTANRNLFVGVGYRLR